MSADYIDVEVIYAEPERYICRTLRLEAGALLAQALALAARDPAFAGLDIEAQPCGIFGRRCAPSEPLRQGDRVEIYRPLTADPKSARRARVAAARRQRS